MVTYEIGEATGSHIVKQGFGKGTGSHIVKQGFDEVLGATSSFSSSPPPLKNASVCVCMRVCVRLCVCA